MTFEPWKVFQKDRKASGKALMRPVENDQLIKISSRLIGRQREVR